MLKTVVLLNVFVKTVIHLFFQDSLWNRKLNRTVFTLGKKKKKKKKNLTDPNILSSSVYLYIVLGSN